LPTSHSGTIEAAEVWKRFRADQRYPRLQDELQRFTRRARGQSSSGGWRWALRDIDLRVEPGASVGLIGPNGSGKSTLLKILTQVMYPTAGRVAVAGRVGALIEVRAGIHPELTGRENIFLTGSLMGLSRRSIAGRFDDIVAFAELEHAIDRQVKYYSTGMQMRLGFGVAAFLEPDVLLVDEVLAVGDASFQQRCLDRMRSVLNAGTTLVFVSHDLAAVEATCAEGIWLNNGEVLARGPVREVLGKYRQSVEASAETEIRVAGRIGARDVVVGTPTGGLVHTDTPLQLKLTLESDASYRAWLYLGITEGTASPIFVINPGREIQLETGATEVECVLPRLPLPQGRYYLWGGVFEGWTDGPELLGWQPIAEFDVYGPELDRAPRAVVRLAPIHVESTWTVGDAG
jgi:ABC-type polysaccharide/polyol phosphate transport system ATPase subunit